MCVFTVVKLDVIHIKCDSVFLSGTSKKEEAADLFVRAANQYKVAKRFKGEE